MENYFAEKTVVFDGPLAPRTVQKLRRTGALCGIFTGTGLAPGAHLLQDVDGQMMLALVPANADETTPDAVNAAFAALGELPDVPVYKIRGVPDDSALTYPVNGILTGAAPMDVNAPNVALKEMTVGETITLELYETAGKETAYELFCEACDFGFRALFQPWEIKRFTVAKDGGVSENAVDE